MKGKLRSTFFLGLLIGVLVGLIIWYWQKSTSAEDGALALLDKLAEAEGKLRRRVVKETAVSAPTSPTPSTPPPAPAVNLEAVKGIGPAFARRLRQEGIDTPEKLAATTPERLVQVLEIGEKRAETILTEARRTK